MALVGIMRRPPAPPPPLFGVRTRPRSPAALRAPSQASASSSIANRLRADAGRNKGVNSFFADIEREMSYQRSELSEEELALQALRRAQRRVGGKAAQLEASAAARRRSASSSNLHSRSGGGYHSQGSSASARRSGSVGGGSATPSPKAASVSSERGEMYRREWELHHEAWEKFQEEPPAIIDVASVPWPPSAVDVLEFLEREHEKKQAFRLACRRWHPDKFFQLYGDCVREEDKAELTSKLNDVFHAIASQWERRQPVKVSYR